MLVSYVVTFYNNFAFIPALVASVAEQQGAFQKELVIADDGSSDEQLQCLHEFIEGFEGFPIHFVPAVENTGPAGCFNRSLGAVNGEIVLPIDADDIFAPDATTHFLELFERYGADFIYGRRRAQGQLGDANKIEIIREPLDYVLKRQVVHMCFAAKIDLLRRVEGADPRLFVQDQSIALRMASQASIMVRSDKTTVFINVDEGGVSRNTAQLNFDRFWMAMNFIDDHPELDQKHVAYLKDTGRSALWKVDRDRGRSKLSSAYFWRYIWGRLTGYGPSVEQMKMMADDCFKGIAVRRV